LEDPGLTIRAFILALLCAILIVPSTSAGARIQAIPIASQPAMFDTEAAAQAHCPRSVVVWLNIRSGIYHDKGMH